MHAKSEPKTCNLKKYHALGNDYLVLDPKSGDQLPSFSDIVRICHRNFGLGSDGILYGPLPVSMQTLDCVSSIQMARKRKRAVMVYVYLHAICMISARSNMHLLPWILWVVWSPAPSNKMQAPSKWKWGQFNLVLRLQNLKLMQLAPP